MDIKKIYESLAALDSANNNLKQFISTDKRFLNNPKLQKDTLNHIEKLTTVLAEHHDIASTLDKVEVKKFYMQIDSLIKKELTAINNDFEPIYLNESMKVKEVSFKKLLKDIFNAIKIFTIPNIKKKSYLQNILPEITFNVTQDDYTIRLSIIDNGASINIEKIKELAINAGLINESDFLTLNQKDLLSLIFNDNFNINELGLEKLKDLKAKLYKELNCELSIESSIENGNTLQVSIPVETTNIGGEEIGINKNTFIIASRDIISHISYSEAREKNYIQTPEGKPVTSLVLEQGHISVIDLRKRFNLGTDNNIINKETTLFIVVGTRGQPAEQVAIYCDNVDNVGNYKVEKIENIWKPTADFKAATIKPDGNISYVLDIQSIIENKQKPEQIKTGKIEYESVNEENIDEYLSFELDNTNYIIKASDKAETTDQFKNFKKLPNTPNYLIGCFSRLGKIIPIIDLNKVIGNTAIDTVNNKEGSLVLIVKIKEKNTKNNSKKLIGLCIEKENDIHKIANITVEPVSELHVKSNTNFYNGIVRDVDNTNTMYGYLNIFKMISSL